MGAVFYNVGPDGKPASTPARIVNFDGATLRIFTAAPIRSTSSKPAPTRPGTTASSPSASAAAAKTCPRMEHHRPGPRDHRRRQDREARPRQQGRQRRRTCSRTSPSGSTPPAASRSSRVFYAPNGDNRTATYSNIRLNGSVNASPTRSRPTARRRLISTQPLDRWQPASQGIGQAAGQQNHHRDSTPSCTAARSCRSSATAHTAAPQTPPSTNTTTPARRHRHSPTHASARYTTFSAPIAYARSEFHGCAPNLHQSSGIFMYSIRGRNHISSSRATGSAT